jgi:hypothetical protein
LAAVEGVNFASSTAEDLERVRDLALAARTYGNPETADTSVIGAFTLADQAINILDQSDRRIGDLRDKVSRIETAGPSTLGEDVLTVYAALNDFDRERMSNDDIEAYDRLSEAREIILASREGILTRNVPIYVASSSTNELPALAVSLVKKGLRDQGFTIVEALERSAVEVALELSDVIEKSVRFSGTTLETAEVDLSVDARWIVSGERISLPRVEGSSAGNDYLSLSREAVSEAAELAVSEIVQIAEQ